MLSEVNIHFVLVENVYGRILLVSINVELFDILYFEPY